MNRRTKHVLSVGALLALLALALPADAVAQRAGVEVWAANCGRCHVIQPTDKYEAKDWRSIGLHMAITARLTTAERNAVIAFLISGARRGAAQGAAQEDATPAPDSATLDAAIQEVVRAPARTEVRNGRRPER